MVNFEHVVTAQAPVNIAVIKYWGKTNGFEHLKIPINDSLSATLNTTEMKTVTTVFIKDTYKEDKLILNGQEQDLNAFWPSNPARTMLEDVRHSSPIQDDERFNYKVHIVSENNFPTAAGLASSAAGYACLAFALGHAYGITDTTLLSRIARKGSGSACRSLFGGFVEWIAGDQSSPKHELSFARQVVDELHWPEMRVVICVVDDDRKDVSSTVGMMRSVDTSSIIRYRANKLVPERMLKMKEAILRKDFNSFARRTMEDSNNFHSVCLDTYPPLFYMNDTSRDIIKLCTLINHYYSELGNRVGYTFDAGPNACIFLLDSFLDTFVEVVRHFFPSDKGSLNIRGNLVEPKPDTRELEFLINHLVQKGFKVSKSSIKYLITTSIGGGPKLIDHHLDEI